MLDVARGYDDRQRTESRPVSELSSLGSPTVRTHVYIVEMLTSCFPLPRAAVPAVPIFFTRRIDPAEVARLTLV